MAQIEVLDAPGGEDPDTAFATAEEVRLRIGRASAFTADETAQVEYLLVTAATRVAEAVGRDDAWAAGLQEVPSALRTTSIEMVARVLLNPRGVRSQSRTLGKSSSSESFADATATLDLTDREELRCRRAVLGPGKASARLGSALDRVAADLGRTGAQHTRGTA